MASPFWTVLCAFLFLLGPLSGRLALSDSAEIAEVEELLHGMFDKPGLTLDVSPIVASGDFAIADWVQGEMGGRALLRRKEGKWVLTLCAGDGIRSHEALKQAGVPQQEALSLERDLAAAEAKLEPQRIAMFSRFEASPRKSDEGVFT